MANRILTQEEIHPIRNALAGVLVDLNKKSPMVDRRTDDPDILDPLHASFAKELKMAEDLMALLDEADEVVVRKDDD